MIAIKPGEPPRGRRLIRLAVIGTLVVSFAIACGKRPDAVDPPPDAENITFPRTYPSE